MSLLARYRESLAQIASQALRDLLAQHPRTSVADLRELVASDPSLGSLTLSQLLGGGAKVKTSAIPKRAAPARSTKAPAAAKPAPQQTQLPFAPTSKKTRQPPGWNTLTAEGRAALDHAVLESLAALGGQSVSAEALRARLGATPAQLRSSLNRHIEAGVVSFSGKARGTRYSLEG